MMNSGPVLYLIYLIFAKEKKTFYCCSKKISAFSGTRGRALGIVYPNVLATNGIKW